MTKFISLSQYLRCCYCVCMCLEKKSDAELMDGWMDRWRNRWMDDDVLKDWCSWKKWSFVELLGGFACCLSSFLPHIEHWNQPWDRTSQWLNTEEFTVSHECFTPRLYVESWRSLHMEKEKWLFKLFIPNTGWTTWQHTDSCRQKPGDCRLLYWIVLDCTGWHVSV